MIAVVKLFAKFAERINRRIYFSLESPTNSLERSNNVSELGISDYEQINVTFAVFLAAGKGTKYESKNNLGTKLPEYVPQLGEDARRFSDDLRKFWI
jgi:hypothetical protein